MRTAVLITIGACGGELRRDTDTECAAGHLEDGVCVSELVYRLEVVSVENSCAAEAIGHVETREYAVRYHRGEADLFVDGVQFATGMLIGCGLGYESADFPASLLPFEEVAPDGWSMRGEADLEGENDACVDGEREWSGAESYSSGEGGGCVYTVTWAGDFLGMN